MNKKCRKCGKHHAKIIIDEINFTTLKCKDCDYIWDEFYYAQAIDKEVSDMQINSFSKTSF